MQSFNEMVNKWHEAVEKIYEKYEKIITVIIFISLVSFFYFCGEEYFEQGKSSLNCSHGKHSQGMYYRKIDGSMHPTSGSPAVDHYRQHGWSD